MREGRRRKRKEGGEKNTSSYAGEVGEESGEKQHVGGLLKEGQRRSEGRGQKKRAGNGADFAARRPRVSKCAKICATETLDDEVKKKGGKEERRRRAAQRSGKGGCLVWINHWRTGLVCARA